MIRQSYEQICTATAALFFIAVALASLTACVPYPPDQLAADTLSNSSGTAASAAYANFGPLDAGAAQVDSINFSVHAYGSDVATQISAQAEQDYSNIMMDTSLSSLMPAQGLSQIYIYANQDEYLKKTGQPTGSDGVTNANAIYSFIGPDLTQTLAHQMTHLIFYAYMHFPGGQINPNERWFEEGLETYEQEKAAGGGQSVLDIFTSIRPSMMQQPIPIDQLQQLAPATEQGIATSVWYCQSESMVQFMIEHGGRMGFAQVLISIQKGQTFDQAIAAGYPGTWGSLADFYQSWQTNLH